MSGTQKTKRETRMFGGKTIAVVVVRSQEEPATIPAATAGLARGMGLTLGCFLQPSKIVTKQYPENRATLKFPERYRAMLKLVYDGQGYHRCTACGLCAKLSCPAIIKVEDVNKKTKRRKSGINPVLCNGCDVCRQVCPASAIKSKRQRA
jgi:NADH-quinone oxidoreductase subunit I